MSFFGDAFRSIRSESLVLIDVSAGSVAGAYAHYVPGALPELLFTRRVPLELRSGEPHERALERALDVLGDALIRDGAPMLARRTGSGSADTILVSVDAPWQETTVRFENFERRTPFTFTKRMLTDALEKKNAPPQGKLLADESFIGTILNGYEARTPYGKTVHRASVIVLTSLIDAQMSESIARMLRKLFHTKNILSVAGSALRYQAMHVAFPHESDVLILDAMGPLISIGLIRRGLLMAVSEISGDLSPKETTVWIQKAKEGLTRLAESFPLPRTIFLLTQEQDVKTLEKALNTAELKGLWLSDNPPKIVSVLANHVSALVRQSAPVLPDLTLILMAVYWQHRPAE